MADKELVRLRSPLTELLSPAMVVPDTRGTVTVHDEPVVGGGVNGYAGQDGSNAEGPADGSAAFILGLSVPLSNTFPVGAALSQQFARPTIIPITHSPTSIVHQPWGGCRRPVSGSYDYV